MAESKNHFRIRNGEIEIEYEGPLAEVNKRFDKAYDWATSQKIVTLKKKEKEKTTDDDQVAGKKDKRGGARKEIYPPWIQKMKGEDFFKQKKSLDDVIKRVADLGVPTKGKRTAIRNALLSDTRKKDSKLHATKEGENWFFWED